VIVKFETNSLIEKLENIAKYSIGFLEGADAGKQKFLNNLGETVIESLKNFIDSNARVSPETLHHVYEWYETGSPQARLFDLEYIVNNNSMISFSYTFSQSNSYSRGSNVPFYDKATIMENGSPVTIKPKKSGVLSFNDNGEQIFTKKPIVVQNPGGAATEDGFENTLKDFFNNYFTQSFLITSGMADHFKDIKTYKQNFAAGSKQGKSLGFKVGYDWVSKGGRIEQ
jgi:hypothetical protein